MRHDDSTVLKMSAVRHFGFIKFEILTPIWLKRMSSMLGIGVDTTAKTNFSNFSLQKRSKSFLQQDIKTSKFLQTRRIQQYQSTESGWSRQHRLERKAIQAGLTVELATTGHKKKNSHKKTSTKQPTPRWIDTAKMRPRYMQYFILTIYKEV